MKDLTEMGLKSPALDSCRGVYRKMSRLGVLFAFSPDPPDILDIYVFDRAMGHGDGT